MASGLFQADHHTDFPTCSAPQINGIGLMLLEESDQSTGEHSKRCHLADISRIIELANLKRFQNWRSKNP